MPSAALVEVAAEADVAAGHGQRRRTAGRRPGRSSGPAPSHSGRPPRRGSGCPAPARTRSGGTCSPAIDERVVDLDRLAGDLLAVLVDGEVGREVAWPAVSGPGASNPKFFTTSSPGVPIGWTVDVRPPATTSPCSTPNRQVTAAATRNRISPRWREQRRHLRLLVAIAVEVVDAVDLGLADAELLAAEHRPDGARRRRRSSPRGPAARGSKNGSGWTTRISRRLAPQPRRAIERADDDRDDQHDQPER